MSSAESSDATIARLQAELAVAVDRANTAETQLLEVRQAVRAFKEKREQVVAARKAQEQRMREEQARIAPAPIPEGPPKNINASMSQEPWEDPDPTLDERLNRYLDSNFEPDRSRKWMLEP